MHNLLILLKNGKEIKFKCEKYATTRSNLNGALIDLYFKGGTGDCPVYLSMSDVEAVIEIVEGE